MKALLLSSVLLLAGCKHEPEVKPVDVRVSEVVLGTTQPTTVDELMALAAVEGYRVEYVAAASETTHLVKVRRADGSELDEGQTRAVVEQLKAGSKFRFVELNRVQQPR